MCSVSESVRILESISVFPDREAISPHCPVKKLNTLLIRILKTYVWYSPVFCNFWNCFCFFDIFDKSLSLPRKHTLVELQFYLSFSLCSTFWESFSLKRFCDTFFVFQSIEVQEIQWNGCFIFNVEETYQIYSETDFKPSGEIGKLLDNTY